MNLVIEARIRSDKAQQAFVANSLTKALHQAVMVDLIEKFM